jgi:glycosyltransferase involved in cell wall biosynthesis
LVGKREGFITNDKTILKEISEIGPRIYLAGQVSDEILPYYYSNADIFVFPSLYEGFGLPLLEAMACDCPVIAANGGALAEICGTAAEYFDPREAGQLSEKILLLIQKETRRNELRNTGKKRIEEFSWEQCACKTIKIIRKMLVPGNAKSSRIG